jgi:ABC-type sugar transport system permease subunit
MDDPLVSHDLGTWFSKGFAAVARSWKGVLVIQIIGAVAIGVLTLLLNLVIFDDLLTTDGDEFDFEVGPLIAGVAFFVLVGIVLQGIITLATARIIVDDAAGRPTNLAAAFNLAGRRVAPWIGWSLVTGILIVIGFVFLIAPGVWLGIVFGASILGVVVFERANPFERCFPLIKGMFWSILGRVLLLILGSVIYTLIVDLIVNSLVSSDANGERLMGEIFRAVFLIPVTMLTAALYVITYAELRNREQPGVTSEGLAQAMDQ